MIFVDNIKNLNFVCDDLLDYLKAVDKSFPVPLSDKVVLEEYAKKLYDNAEIFVAYENDTIVGIFAGYVNDYDTKMAYGSVLTVLDTYQGCGIATRLLDAFCDCAKSRNMEKIMFCVYLDNEPAMKLYTKKGFAVYKKEEENRAFLIKELK